MTCGLVKGSHVHSAGRVQICVYLPHIGYDKHRTFGVHIVCKDDPIPELMVLCNVAELRNMSGSDVEEGFSVEH